MEEASTQWVALVEVSPVLEEDPRAALAEASLTEQACVEAVITPHSLEEGAKDGPEALMLIRHIMAKPIVITMATAAATTCMEEIIPLHGHSVSVSAQFHSLSSWWSLLR